MAKSFVLNVELFGVCKHSAAASCPVAWTLSYEWTLVINLDLLSSYFVNNYETSNTFQGFSFLFLSFIIILRVESKLHAANVLLFTTHMAYISKHNETWKNTTHHLYLYTYCIIAICVLLLLCLH